VIWIVVDTSLSGHKIVKRRVEHANDLTAFVVDCCHD
jgi:hypothetical protein